MSRLSLAIAALALFLQGCDSGGDTPPPVRDTTPPTIQITSPADNATVQGVVSVSYTANDNVGVASVELLVDGVVRASGADGVARLDTEAFADGGYSVSLRATDTSGNRASIDQPIVVFFRNSATRARVTEIRVLSFTPSTVGAWDVGGYPDLYIEASLGASVLQRTPIVYEVRSVDLPAVYASNLQLTTSQPYTLVLWDADVAGDPDDLISTNRLDLSAYARERPSSIIVNGSRARLFVRLIWAD